MADSLKGTRIAFLVANDGTEQVELVEPRQAEGVHDEQRGKTTA